LCLFGCADEKALFPFAVDARDACLNSNCGLSFSSSCKMRANVDTLCESFQNSSVRVRIRTGARSRREGGSNRIVTKSEHRWNTVALRCSNGVPTVFHAYCARTASVWPEISDETVRVSGRGDG